MATETENVRGRRRVVPPGAPAGPMSGAVPSASPELVRVFATAAAAAALVLAAGPQTGDAAAHLYRTLLVRDGVTVWDSLWYGGQYPLASYSLLYYLPAAVVGNVPLVAAAAVLSALLFARVALRQWGDVARWPARVFAVLAAGPLVTGTYSYAVGLAALLGTVRALQAGRTRLVVLGAILTMGFSPLAFVFLCLVLVAVFVVRPRLNRRVAGVAFGIAAAAGIEAAALIVFPDPGRYPFAGWHLASVLVIALGGAAVSRRAPGARVLVAFFSLWAAASLAAFVLPSPVGDNIARLSFVLFPLLLLAASLARFRPRALVLATLLAGLAGTVTPYAVMVVQRHNGASARPSFWTPTLAYLRRRGSFGYRVEVVPTLEHWEAYYLPRAGFALARGWYRQLDLEQNPLLYRPSIPPAGYRRWLRSLGVRFVVVPRTALDVLGARPEARLLNSGRSGLRLVLRSPNAAVYELPHATPILTGPADPRLTSLGHAIVAGRVARPGLYRLRVRFTPYWQVTRGRMCVSRASNGQTLLRAWTAGPFRLAITEEWRLLLGDVTRGRSGTC